jgi:hypothetical protein
MEIGAIPHGQRYTETINFPTLSLKKVINRKSPAPVNITTDRRREKISPETVPET